MEDNNMLYEIDSSQFDDRASFYLQEKNSRSIIEKFKQLNRQGDIKVSDLTEYITPYPLEFRETDYPMKKGDGYNDGLPILEQMAGIEDLFIIPSDRGILAYSPTKRLVARLNTREATVMLENKQDELFHPLGDFIRRPAVDLQKIEDLVNSMGSIPTDLFILPTTRCQLQCRYCFSEAGQIIAVDMSPELAKHGIDTCIENVIKQNRKLFYLRFLGGGEPTLHWTFLKEITEYARKAAAAKNLESYISIVTNGMLSEEQASFLAENIDEITFSFDGPPDIQNYNRSFANGKPSYQILSRSIQKVDSLQGNYLFRATIPSNFTGRMEEIVEYFCTNYNPRRICLEPLSECGRCEQTNSKTPDSDDFVTAFIRARQKGAGYNIPVEYSSAKISRISLWFCTTTGRQFGLNPDGSVTACGEVDLDSKKHNHLFIYGNFNEDTKDFTLDIGHVDKLRQRTIPKLEYCKNCFAKYHCAGGCPIRALRDTNDVNKPFMSNCKKVRTLIADELFNIVTK
jgi:uncharacterized protein